MKKRILAMLMALVMVLSLCPTTAFAAPAAAPDIILTDSIVVTNPLYPELEPEEIPHSHIRFVSPSAVTSEANYGTLEQAAQDVRDYVKARTETFTVYMRLKVSSYDQEVLQTEIEAAIKELWDTALAHTGDPVEGDYIKWQWKQYGIDDMEITGDASGLKLPMTWHVTYYTTAAQEQEMDEAVEDLLKELDLGKKSDYEKIYGIYDYICHHVVYDDANLNNQAHTLKYTAYAALINGTSVCQGYATLFYRLALELGVDARLIPGDSSGGAHSWNIAELNNLYYNLDSTWDANVAANGWDYQYFLKCEANFPDHARWEDYTTAEFVKAYPMATTDYTPGTEPEPTEPQPTEHTHSYQKTVTAPTCTEAGYTTYTCACGDSYTADEKAPLGHTGGKATCQAPAVCSRCSQSYGEKDAGNHTGGTEVKNAKDATCTEPGYTGDTYCKGCGVKTASGQEIAALGHSFGAWVVVTEPTTEKEGVEERTCSACGAKETRPVDKLPEETDPTEPEPTEPEPTEHTHSYTAVVTEPTCTEGGYTTYTCECGDSFTGNETAALGHSFGAWVVVTEPTTENEGQEKRTCTACGATETRPIDKLPEETDPTEPEPTDPEPTEPEPTDPEPTEPEPTDPEPTDPAPGGKYPITVNVRTEGGTYDLSWQEAAAGNTVTVRLKPDEGYCLDSFEYSFDGEGGEITLYSDYIEITMPEGAVTLDLYYIPAFEIRTYRDDLIASVYTYTYINDFKVRAENAPEGRSVYLLVTPYPGMDIDQIVVYYGSSYPPEMYSLGKNEYGDDIFEIIMPDGDLEIYVTSTALEEHFVDVDEDDYYYDPVRWALRHKITAGVDDTHFAPNMTCSRAQVVTFLWRAAGQPEPVTTGNPFSDVKTSDYFYKAVLWAVENGVTAGTGNGKFSPNAPCTRAQVATFLWRAVGEPSPSSDYNPFSDVKPGQYYTEAILWAVEYGITAGTGNGKFSPNAACSRGQIVTFLYRLEH